jgi:excisionase family DNA binding protein
MEEDTLLTPEEAGQALKVRPRTVLRWAREGKIPSVRLTAKVVRFSANAIKDLVKGGTIAVQYQITTQTGCKSRSGERQKKGGSRKSSGELWKDLRKEVRQWQ